MNNIYKWQIKIIVVYCFSSKYALIFLLKECTDDEHFTVSGKLFHILGPLTLISLSPVIVCCLRVKIWAKCSLAAEITKFGTEDL